MRKCGAQMSSKSTLRFIAISVISHGVCGEIASSCCQIDAILQHLNHKTENNNSSISTTTGVSAAMHVKSGRTPIWVLRFNCK